MGLVVENKHNQTLPPRRGQIKIRIFRSILKSASAFTPAGGGINEKRRKEDGGFLSSTSTTSPIPSGYESEA